MFEYAFMRRAFAVGLLLGVIMPCIGVMIVLKRLSMLGDALSHTSLAGVAAGLLLDIDPVLGATAACVAAAFGIEVIRKKIPQYAELSIAVMLSAGVGLAGVLSGFVRNAAGFNSFLFGSIVAITPGELTATAVISVLVLAAFVLLYKELFAIALDENAAHRAGVPVGAVNSLYTILTAATVSVAARTVGALIVSSMLVLPVACAMQVARSYRQNRVVQHPVCRGLYRRRADAGFLCRAEAGRYDRAAGCWLSACDSCGQNSGGALFPQKA